MRKFLSVVIAILMALMPFTALAANPSPSLETMIKSQPAIAYHLVNYDDSWQALFNDLKIDPDFSAYFETGEYSLDEALIIEVDKQYELVTWHFMLEYKPEHQVIMVLKGDQSNDPIIQAGLVNENGSVTFDYSEVEPDLYYMFIFSTLTIKGQD